MKKWVIYGVSFNLLIFGNLSYNIFWKKYTCSAVIKHFKYFVNTGLMKIGHNFRNDRVSKNDKSKNVSLFKQISFYGKMLIHDRLTIINLSF